MSVHDGWWFTTLRNIFNCWKNFEQLSLIINAAAWIARKMNLEELEFLQHPFQVCGHLTHLVDTKANQKWERANSCANVLNYLFFCLRKLADLFSPKMIRNLVLKTATNTFKLAANIASQQFRMNFHFYAHKFLQILIYWCLHRHFPLRFCFKIAFNSLLWSINRFKISQTNVLFWSATNSVLWGYKTCIKLCF